MRRAAVGLAVLGLLGGCGEESFQEKTSLTKTAPVATPTPAPVDLRPHLLLPSDLGVATLGRPVPVENPERWVREDGFLRGLSRSGNDVVSFAARFESVAQARAEVASAPAGAVEFPVPGVPGAAGRSVMGKARVAFSTGQIFHRVEAAVARRDDLVVAAQKLYQRVQ